MLDFFTVLQRGAEAGVMMQVPDTNVPLATMISLKPMWEASPSRARDASAGARALALHESVQTSLHWTWIE